MINRKKFYYLTFMVNILLLIYLISYFKTLFANKNVTLVYLNDNSDQKFYQNKNYLDESDKHLIWFIHITDLHISEFHDVTRINDFKVFCNETLNLIKPKAVVVTGDITDGKDKSLMGSDQFESEWKIYNSILKDNRVLDKSVWLDVRGNHDNFNVPDVKSEKNLFSKYGMMGNFGRSYKYELNTEIGDKYTFIALDASLTFGLKRPFNFYGNLHETDIKQLEEFSKSSVGSNGTIWFGHYPMSTIISPKSIPSIMTNGIAYLCGHLHTLGDFIPNLFTRHSNGLLELELADWKAKRAFRIMAFDGGIFSFNDYIKSKPIYILITNPKNIQFKSEREVNVKQIKYSTHIRFLIFSKLPILNADVYINDEFIGIANKAKFSSNSTPLYVLPWNPNIYRNGIHKIKVSVVDSNKNFESATHRFTIEDNLTLEFGFFRSLILTNENCTITKLVFFMEWFFVITILLFFRFYRKKFVVRFITCGAIRTYLLTYVRRFVLLSSANFLFWYLLLSLLYIPIGPWFVGEVMDDHYGVCFIWGIFVNGTWTKTDLQYIAAFQHVLLFIFPLIFDLSYQIENRFKSIHLAPNNSINNFLSLPAHIDSSKCLLVLKFFYIHFLFIFLTLFTAFQAYELGVSYSLIAFIISPLKTWNLIIACYLRYKCMHLTQIDFEKFIISKTEHHDKIVNRDASELEQDSLID